MGRQGAVRWCLTALTGIAVVIGSTLLPAGSDAAGGRPGAVASVRVGEPRTHGADARLVVRWRAARGATSYEVFRSRSRSMRGATSLRTGGTAAVVRGLRADERYCFRVRAVKRAGKRLVNGPGSPVVCARTPAPVRTSRPVWVVQQQLATSGQRTTTTLTLRWPRVGGAASYDLLYAPSMDVVGSRGLRVRRGIPRGGGATETARVGGLAPGRTYCFQVRGRSRTGVGLTGPAHCKVALPAGRAPVESRLAVHVATFNVCGKAAACQRWSWTQRRPVVEQHVLASGADVVAIQEARQRIPDIDEDLRRSGFTRACTASGAQAVFVRRSAYVVVAGSSGTVRFAEDPSHGGCWVRLRHRATGSPLVVASVHLAVGQGGAATRMRARQTSQVLGLMQRRYGEVGASSTPPFVLAGDFNSHRSHRVDAPRVRLARHGFADAYDVSATYAAPYRNSANRYRVVPVTSVRWGSHVDRVFVPRGASVTGWRTVSRVRDGRYVAPLPSDHHPVAVTVHLPARDCVLGILC